MGKALGIIILLIGLILLIGNISGLWPSFSYAGYIMTALGALILKMSED